MQRYVVVDTDCAEDGAEVVPGAPRGRLVDSFRTEESAKALALQRMSYGDVGVVVFDSVSGKQVFPRPDATGGGEEHTPSSGTRLTRSRRRAG